MNRRQFLATLAALPAIQVWDGGRDFTLQAIAGPLLPSEIKLPRAVAEALAIQARDSRIFELRTYRKPQPAFARAFGKLFPYSLPLSCQGAGECTWLLPFKSLPDRERAWNLANSRRQWARLHNAFDSYGFSIYRVGR
jgi:hypothetical protein